jgi:site-specific recombinase XerD
MKKQEILDEYYKLLKIENYSEQTVKSYYSSLKMFLDRVAETKLENVNNNSVKH